jgi:hypothetical protein
MPSSSSSSSSSSRDAAVSLGTGAPLAFEVITVGSSGVETSLISDASRMHVNRRVKASDDIPTVERDKEGTLQAREDKLSEWMATGICGNNITSSALYVVALCSVPAGKYAPVALAGIATLLYLFRRIYEEVVTALPVNGGTYNLLLNTTTKSVASVAACLTMLSYVTTAVISATSAMRYIHTLCEGDGGCVAIGSTTDQSVIVTTLITLSFAAFLNIMGITESAGVALVIFGFHMLSMVILVVASLITAVSAMPTLGVPEALVSEVTGAALSGAASAVDVASSYVLNFSLAATDLPTYAASCECINATATLLAENATRAAAEDAVSFVGVVFFAR